ncbi:MAG: hypothetical protein JNL58_10815 [Planctomyces sp.]|nr:hypothetical protein [Planctomyces sp.]
MNHEPDDIEEGKDVEFSDSRLNELLSAAEWPEIPGDAVTRLRALCKESPEQSSVVDKPAAAVTAGRQSTDFRSAADLRSVADVYRRNWISWIVTAGVIAAAFVAGQWFEARRSSRQVVRQPEVESPAVVSQDSPATEQTTENPANVGIEAAPSEMMPREDSSTDMVAETPSDAGVPEKLIPTPEEAFGSGGKHRSRRDKLREQYQTQLKSVLACLEEQQLKEHNSEGLQAGAGNTSADLCLRPLMEKREEFEYLLWEMIRTTTGQQRLTALTAIGYVGTPKSVPLLMSTTSDADLRGVALEALKRCADEATITGFVLQQRDDELSREFCAVLASRQTDSAAQAWIHLVQNPSRRSHCLQAADELSEELVERFFQMLDSSLAADRIAAAVSLGSRTDPQTRKRLVGLIQAFPHRWEPVAALMWNGSPESMRVLQQLQGDTTRFAVLQTASVQLTAFVGQSRRTE